jgi:starvation-inducible DNA-binding protein
MSTTFAPAPSSSRVEAAAALQRLLPELVALTLFAKQAHWNVKGPAFLPLHDLTEELAADTRAWADRVAERATALGFSVDARPRIVAAAAGEFPEGWVRDREVIAGLGTLVADAARTARTNLESIGSADPVAEDIHIEVLEGLEKYAWLLRSGAV